MWLFDNRDACFSLVKSNEYEKCISKLTNESSNCVRLSPKPYRKCLLADARDGCAGVLINLLLPLLLWISVVYWMIVCGIHFASSHCTFSLFSVFLFSIFLSALTGFTAAAAAACAVSTIQPMWVNSTPTESAADPQKRVGQLWIIADADADEAGFWCWR